MKAEAAGPDLSTHLSTSICSRRRSLKTTSRRTWPLKAKLSSMMLMTTMCRYIRKNKIESFTMSIRPILGLLSGMILPKYTSGNRPNICWVNILVLSTKKLSSSL